MSHAHYCPHCRASLRAPRSRLIGSIVVGVAWTIAMAMVFGGLLLGPLIVIVLPFLFPAGFSIITAAHDWAFEDWTCQACGKLVELEPAGAPTPRLATARAA